MLVQPNALLGARSNVVRTTQRGPRMLLGTDGLRSARAMPLLQQAVDPNLRPTHTVVSHWMSSSSAILPSGTSATTTVSPSPYKAINWAPQFFIYILLHAEGLQINISLCYDISISKLAA